MPTKCGFPGLPRASQPRGLLLPSSLTGAPLAPQPEDFPLGPPCLPRLKGALPMPASVPHTKASQLCGQGRAHGLLLYSGVSSEALGSCPLHFAEVLTPAQGLQLVAVFLSPLRLAGWAPSGANGPPGRIQRGTLREEGRGGACFLSSHCGNPCSCPPSLSTTARGLPIPVTCVGPGRFLHRPSQA